jgi:O-antigen/teichoic acid export membrane protein
VVQIVLQRLDVILVAAIVSPSAAALYAVATRFLVVGQFGSQAITLALQPRLSAALGRHDHGQANSLYQVSTSWLVLLTWPLYLLVIAFPAGMLSIFGHRYTEATDVVVILCATMLVATACGQVDSVLMMAGRSTWNLGNALVALTVDVVIDVILLPRIGIKGAAIGWAAAILVNNLLPLAQVWFSTRLHPFGRGTLIGIVITSVAVLACAASVRLLVGDTLLAAFAAGVLALLVLAPVAWALRRPLGLTLFSLRR